MHGDVHALELEWGTWGWSGLWRQLDSADLVRIGNVFIKLCFLDVLFAINKEEEMNFFSRLSDFEISMQ